MAEEKQRISQKAKTIIIVLLCLLLLTAGAFTARIVYLNFFEDKTVTTVVPDNLIGEEPESEPSDNAEDNSSTTTNAEDSVSGNPAVGNSGQAVTIELYKGKASDNEKFEVHNMLPGDCEVKYFAVKVNHHKSVEVFFNAEVTEQTKNLANVLNIKITHLENNNVLYNGSFADMNKNGYSELFATSSSTETVAYYKIEVSLPTSAGNEYQAASLLADFNWYVTDKAALDSPQTGDTSNIILILLIMLCSLGIITVLLFSKRNNKEDKNAK